MATNIEILGMNATHPVSYGDQLNQFSPVNLDAEIIAKEILRDIFETAVRKSDESQQKNSEEKDTNTGDPETCDLIDLTRNYKQEFRTILQNLKCNTHNCSPTNSSLEEQIKKVIDEIKNLETSVRQNIEHEGLGDNEAVPNEEISSNPTEYKSETIDFQTEPNASKIPPESSDEDANSEIVLQVMNLQEEDNCLVNVFPLEKDLEEVNLSSEDRSTDQHNRPISEVASSRLSNTDLQAEEMSVLNSVPDSDLEDKQQYPEEEKKKSIGRRLWRFIKKGSKPSSAVSVNRKRDEL